MSAVRVPTPSHRVRDVRRGLIVLRLSLPLLAFLGPACSRDAEPPELSNPHLEELRRTHASLHETLEGLVAGDSLLEQAAADSGEVVLALRETLMEGLIHEVTRRYLDRVELNLTPDVKVEEQGEIKVKALFARIKAGEWKVRLTIHSIRGVMRAKTPTVSVTGTNRIHLVLPVVVQEGQGSATIRFTWDAKSVANVVCGDFETVQRVRGSVLPQEYSIEGDFVLAAGEQTVVAEPQFPEEKFRLKVDLSRESWAEVQRTLASQDEIFKCGIALNPPDVVRKLRALGSKGFNIKLPRSIFRPVELPATVSESVVVEGRRVQLSVRPSALRVTPRTFWYSAAVSTEIGDAQPDTLRSPAERERASRPEAG